MEIAVTIASTTLPQVFDATVVEWGTTTPQESLSTISSVGAPWNESEVLAILFSRTKHECTHAITTKDPIAPIAVVDSVLKCIMANPSYSDVYFCFKGLVDQKYSSLMTRFKTTEVHMKEVKDVTSQHRFGSGTIEK